MNDNTSCRKTFSVTPELFEVMGAILGDGCIKYYRKNEHNYYILEIYGHPKDDLDYLSYLAGLLERITGKTIKPRLKDKNEKEALIAIYSKDFVEFLVKVMRFPHRKKTYTASLSEEMLRYSWGYKKLLIRGLVDTDGCLFFGKKGCYKNYSYPMIELKLRSGRLVEQTHGLLESKGFAARLRRTPDGYMCLYLSGEKQLELWIKEIGFKNNKHITKYNAWKADGFCLPNRLKQS